MKVGDRVKTVKTEKLALIDTIYLCYGISHYILKFNDGNKSSGWLDYQFELVPELDIRLQLLADINS